MEDALCNLSTAWEKGKGSTVVLPHEVAYSNKVGEKNGVCLCVSSIKRGYADARLRLTLHSKSFCLPISNSAEI